MEEARAGWTSWFDRLYAVGAVRKTLWRQWYPLLTWCLKREGVTFLNYAYETEPPMQLPLAPEDERNRASIQLYHHVTEAAELRGREVLEVSCGHGGGAAYLMRARKPRSYTGLDLNPKGIRFCRKRHRLPGLEFVRGDAERLPFETASFDVVINVEASHCYGDFGKFLKEVTRVLRPGGQFLYADFRDPESVPGWERALEASSLRMVRMEDISEEVVRGMDCNSARSGELVRRKLPWGFRALGGDFAGVKGSRIYNAFKTGGLVYRACCLVKEPAARRDGERVDSPALAMAEQA